MTNSAIETASEYTKRGYRLGEEANDATLRDLVALAAKIASSPAAFIGVFEPDRYVVLAARGIDASRLERSGAFELSAALARDLLAISDTHKDQRISSDILVTGPPFVRAWVGVPLISRAGDVVGVLEILDAKVRQFVPAQLDALRIVGRLAMSHLEQRRDLAALRHLQDEAELSRQELRETEERFHDLFECSDDLIMTIAADGTLLHCNRAAQDLLGLGTEARSTIFDAIHPEAVDDFKSVFLEMIHGEGSQRVETVFLADGRRRVTMEGTLIPKVIGGRTALARVIFRDISARKQFETQLGQARDGALEAARMKAQFLNNISHEIRTPMNVVVGMIELLASTTLSEEQRNLIRTAQSSAESLLSLINNILHVSKLESGKLAVTVSDIDLYTTLRRVTEVMKLVGREKGIGFDLVFDPDLPTIVRGDVARLRQVLVNLIGNAIKFTAAGRVTVSVTLDREDENLTIVRFSVKDTGVGLSGEAVQSIFDPFYQVDSSLTRSHGGAGLGLATSKQLVELMSGSIGVESEPGRGSLFWFTIPFERRTVDLIAESARRSAMAGHRLLLVDHSQTSRKIIEHFTTSWGMRIESCPSLALASQLLRSEASVGDPFRVVIFDLLAAGEDPTALARELSREKRANPINLVALVPLGEEINDQELRSAGISACLSKPVDQSELYDCLSIALAHESLAHTAAPATPPVSALKTIPERRRETLRVLVAEDKPLNQKLALMQLRNLGFAADAVSNGAEAVAAVETTMYDAILMDCQMPVMDGYQATIEIRRRSRGAHRPRIIAMTAHALEGDRQKCLAAGMDDYLSKPIRQEMLEAALTRGLG